MADKIQCRLQTDARGEENNPNLTYKHWYSSRLHFALKLRSMKKDSSHMAGQGTVGKLYT